MADINTRNNALLYSLSTNDQDFTELRICDASYSPDYETGPDYDDFVHRRGKGDLVRLGKCIDSNTSIRELRLDYHKSFKDELEGFGQAMNHNKHIEKILFCQLRGGNIFQAMMPFFANNDSLTRIQIENCDFGDDGYEPLARAIDGCTRSLRAFH